MAEKDNIDNGLPTKSKLTAKPFSGATNNTGRTNFNDSRISTESAKPKTPKSKTPKKDK